MMSYKNAKLSLGGSAIAAVLALSSTPLIAQDAVSTDSAVQTVSPTPEPTAPVADPLAPAAEPAASVETTATAAPAKPVAAKTAANATKPRTTAAKRASAATAKPAAAATNVPAPVAEAAPATTPDLAEQGVPLADLTEAPAVPEAEDKAAIDPDVVPIAGAAGLGILALAGAGLAARRRKRRREDLDSWDDEKVPAEPSFARPAVHEPAMAAATPVGAGAMAASHEAPAGSSPRIRAAYAGPTEGNPSLSLKKRLKRARALDQMDRSNGVAAPIAKPQAAATVNGTVPAFQFQRMPERKPAFQY